jgi:esterase/lipase
MCLASGDVRDHIVHTKTTTDHRIGATGLCCGGAVKNQLSRNFSSRSIFDFCNSIGAKQICQRVEVS